MKIKIITLTAITTLCITLFVALGCTKQNGEISLFCGGDRCLNVTLSGGILSCGFTSFLTGARAWSYVYHDTTNNFQLYIIIGEVQEETYLHGRKIRIKEDLAGNFPKDVNTFMAWGGVGSRSRSIFGLDDNRYTLLSCLDCIKAGDNLIMVFHEIPSEGGRFTLSDFFPQLEPDYEWILTLEHFVLPVCGTTVLRLKDGYVKGRITGWAVQTMSWTRFQRELNNVLQKTD